jgi:long-chain fatty acid transport protein
MKFKVEIGILWAWTLFVMAPNLWAGGFQVNLQGVAQMGMGHTGAGLAFDASVGYFNPGGLAFAPSSVSVGITPIVARISYLAPSPDTYSITNERTVSPPFHGHASYRYRINDRHSVAIGASVYTPFGSRVLYADDWKGQFALREIALKTIFIQPTIGYNFSDKFGIGGGPVFATGDVLLRRAMPVQFTDGSYGEATLTATGKGMGFNAGAMARPMEELTLGLSYRSSVQFEARDGQANFVVPSPSCDGDPGRGLCSS